MKILCKEIIIFLIIFLYFFLRFGDRLSPFFDLHRQYNCTFTKKKKKQKDRDITEKRVNMEYYTFPAYTPNNNIGDYVDLGSLGEDLFSEDMATLVNNIPVESISNSDLHDPVKNTIFNIQSFWHLEQIKEIKLGEILVLGFKYPEASLTPHLHRLDAEYLPNTTIICRNPTIQTIQSVSQLESVSYISLNTFVYLEIGRSIRVSKLLHDLQLSNLNQNVFAKLTRSNKIANKDRSQIKQFLEQYSSKYPLTELTNLTKQVILEHHGREAIFESEHICLSCNRMVKSGHTDISCQMGKITETSKCHFLPFSAGLKYPCVRKYNTNHNYIHANIISHKSFYTKIPLNDLKLNVKSSWQWQNISPKLDITRSINVVEIQLKFEEENRMTFVKTLLPLQVMSNQIMLAINCCCDNRCISHEIKTKTKIPCQDKKCNCTFFLINNFLCLLSPSNTSPATALTAPVVSDIIRTKLGDTQNMAQKNNLVFYIFSNSGDKMCFGKSFHFLYQLFAKLPKLNITIIYVSDGESNIREISTKYDIPVISC